MREGPKHGRGRGGRRWDTEAARSVPGSGPRGLPSGEREGGGGVGGGAGELGKRRSCFCFPTCLAPRLSLRLALIALPFVVKHSGGGNRQRCPRLAAALAAYFLPPLTPVPTEAARVITQEEEAFGATPAPHAHTDARAQSHGGHHQPVCRRPTQARPRQTCRLFTAGNSLLPNIWEL